jgi:hypothetical protein
MTTSAASVNDESGVRYDEAQARKPVGSEDLKVLEGDGDTKQARVAPVPLHITANASIGKFT